jgi:hypothetical protein
MRGFLSKLFGRSPGSELQKHTITSLTDLKLKKTSAKDYKFFPSCSVYVRTDGTWVFPQNEIGPGSGSEMVGPAEKMEVGADANALGAAVMVVLGRSKLREWDGKTPRIDPKAPQSAGFKSYGDLEKGAALLQVRRNGDQAVVGAWAATKDGGYEPVAGTERTCQVNAAAIGSAILELVPVCVRREKKVPARAGGKNRVSTAKSKSGDAPVSFGYKASWIAVPAGDAAAIADAMGLTNVQRCSWNDGIARGCNHEGVFITPAIGKWMLSVGSHGDISHKTFAPYLTMLSERFGEAYYFGTHRVVGYQAWAKAVKGKIVRAFGYLGERGEFLINVGERTAEEIEIDAGLEDEEAPPDEETVLDLASKWVLDPRELDAYEGAEGPGWFGVRR